METVQSTVLMHAKSLILTVMYVKLVELVHSLDARHAYLDIMLSAELATSKAGATGLHNGEEMGSFEEDVMITIK